MLKENKQIKNGELNSPKITPYHVESISLYELELVLNSVLGRVLTIAEATVESNKLSATKSLIKEAIWKDINEIRKWHYEKVVDELFSPFPLVNKGEVNATDAYVEE